MELELIALQGGMDQVSIPILMEPGKLLSSSNFEPDINGGYRSMAGYERFDGRPSPSDAIYHLVEVVISGSVSVGDTVEGSLSGATGKVLLVVDSDTVVLGRVVGDFTDGEDFEISAVVQGSIVTSTEMGATSGLEHSEYKYLAAEDIRPDIEKVPGEGPVRGGFEYLGDIYAFRDNVGATECGLFKATSTGWDQITFGRELQFKTATAQINEGDTVTGATSGASGQVKRVLLRNGTWSIGGVGTLVFDTITGSFQDNELLQVSASNKATADGVDTAITLLPGGRVVSDQHNFFAAEDTIRVYFTDGVNELHEFDGERIVPIRTGATLKPKYVFGHRDHLVLGIGSSIQTSSTGEPYSWNAATGAVEIGLGDVVTGLLPQTGDMTGGVLFATTRSKTFILYGNNQSDFRLVEHSADSGAEPYTLQNIGHAYYLDAKGIVSLRTSQAFGGFDLAVISRAIQPVMTTKVNSAKASVTAKFKNQYRLFFDDGSGVILHARGGSKSGIELMYFEYTTSDMFINAAFSYISEDSKERVFGCGSDGYVYELDRGTSHDGEPFHRAFMTVFNTSRSPRDRKRYRRCVLHYRAANTATINIGYDLSFGNLDPSYGSSVSMTAIQAQIAKGAGAVWDLFNWDNFTWDESYAQELNIDTPGTGVSLAIIVAGESAKDEPYTLHTAILHYLPGRRER